MTMPIKYVDCIEENPWNLGFSLGCGVSSIQLPQTLYLGLFSYWNTNNNIIDIPIAPLDWNIQSIKEDETSLYHDTHNYLYTFYSYPARHQISRLYHSLYTLPFTPTHTKSADRKGNEEVISIQ